MNFAPNGQQTRYSGSTQSGPPSNIFAPVVDSSGNNGMAPMRGPMGSTLNRQSSTSTIGDYGSPVGSYGVNSMPASSSQSVIMTPPMPRTTSMNMGGISSGASIASGMPMGMNNMSMNNMSMNNMSMNNMGMGMNGLNNVSMSNMSAMGMPNAMGMNSTMTPMSGLVSGVPGALSPMIMTPAGLSPMATAGTAGMTIMPMNMVGGISPYGGLSSTASTTGLIPLATTTGSLLSPSSGASVFSPLLPAATPVSSTYNPLNPTGQLAYVAPSIGQIGINAVGSTGGAPISTDPALEHALRQSMVDSTPRWMADQSLQAAREEAMKKQNDDMLERAIRQSLDETNLHRLRQDEIERSNRILQQSNERALEEAIRASLHDYCHEDISRIKSVDAIEQANEGALQRAILQSMQEGRTTSASKSSRHQTAMNSSSATLNNRTTVVTNYSTSNSNIAAANGHGNGSPRVVTMNRIAAHSKSNAQQQQQSQQHMYQQQSSQSHMHSQSQSQMLLNRGSQQPYRPGPFPPEPPPQVPYYQVQYQQTVQQRDHHHNSSQIQRSDDANDFYPDEQQRNHPNSSPRTQMMMGMMVRRSFDEQDHAHPQQQHYQQQQQYPSRGGRGENYVGEGEDYEDEYMQNASYMSPPQYLPNNRYHPSSQFISVGGGNVRSITNTGNNDGETVVSSSSSGAGIGRNTAAQVTSLYLNNPDLIEQELQQRYQRQYQLYLQQQLANADMANQRLASTSQDAYEQIQQHHGSHHKGAINLSPFPNAPPPQSVAKAVFENVQDATANNANHNSSAGNYHTNSTPADSITNNNSNSNNNASSFTATTLQSPNKAAFMEKLRRKGGSHNSLDESAVTPVASASGAEDEKLLPHRGSYLHMPTESSPFNNPKLVENHRSQTPPPIHSSQQSQSEAHQASFTKSQTVSTLTSSPTKTTSVKSFHVPRASFHQFIDGTDSFNNNESSSTYQDEISQHKPQFQSQSGHHQLGVHHGAPHRLSKHEIIIDEYGIPITVDEKHHPHLHELKTTLSQTQMSLSSDSEEDNRGDKGDGRATQQHHHNHNNTSSVRPTFATHNSNVSNNNNNRSGSQHDMVVPAFPTSLPSASTENSGVKTMKKTFSAPKMVDLVPEETPAAVAVAPKASRPGMYDRNVMESVDLDPSKIKIQRKIIHSAVKPT